MFWGCMTSKGLGYGCQIYDGTMKAVDYIGILDTTLWDSLEYYEYEPGDFIFQHDNDRKHTATATKILHATKVAACLYMGLVRLFIPFSSPWYLKIENRNIFSTYVIYHENPMKNKIPKRKEYIFVADIAPLFTLLIPPQQKT